MVTKLTEGNLVGTLDLTPESNEPGTFLWTRATDVTILKGNWTAHSFTFVSGHQLTVTSPHVMIVWKDGVPYFLRADQVQVGDVMKVGQELTQVTMIQDQMIGIKVAIETEDGTIQANGVLASGICDHNPELLSTTGNSKEFVKKYKSFHFGENYIYMCMDPVAWKNAYILNNQFPL